ncbi:MAG TPA: DUF4190 domain-containing protein [Polyangiaceae bacterium]|jgi:hypothetical protein
MQGYTPPPAYPQNPYGPGYAPQVMVDPGECALARQALIYSIIGLFCFGIVLGPLAISKARSAKMILAVTPGMRGEGMATAALILGIFDLALWVVGLVLRIALMH